MRLLLCLFFLAGACTHKMTAPIAAGEARAAFPFGKYRHDVRIQTHGPQPQNMSMTGALSYSEKEIKLVGLSPMSTTLLKLTDNLETGELKTEYFVDSLQKADPYIRSFYAELREALTTKNSSTKFSKNGTDFVFSDLDEHKVPRTFYLANPRFEVTVKVVGYEN